MVSLSDLNYEKGAGVNFVNHSQGNILYQVGLLTLDASDFGYLDSSPSQNASTLTTVSYGSPVNITTMDKALHRLGLQKSDAFANPGDYVAEGFGANSGHNESLLPGWSAIINIGNAPKLFDNKYPSQGKVSPHSTYLCEKHCGRDGLE